MKTNEAVGRPVRIFVAMDVNNPIRRAIEKVVRLMKAEYRCVVEKIDEADLVIFCDTKDIERRYDKDKFYVFIQLAEKVPVLPEGCFVIPLSEAMLGLMKAVGDVHEELKPIVEVPVIDSVSVRSDAMRILVIDDTAKNIKSAKVGLAGHILTTVTGYEDALDILEKEKFDVVLTDMNLPMSSKNLCKNFKLGELVPYGTLLMMKAAHQGAKYVGIVSDIASHPEDPVSATFENYTKIIFCVDSAKVMFIRAKTDSDGYKDWADALLQLMKG